MSMTAYAVFAVGVKVHEKDLYLDKKVRGCKHAAKDNAKFCPECGKPMWDETTAPRKEYDESQDTFCGFDIVRSGTDGDSVIIGFEGVKAGDYEQPMMMSIPHWSDKNLEDTKRQLKEKLEPLGLWKEKNFGQWLIQYASY